MKTTLTALFALTVMSFAQGQVVPKETEPAARRGLLTFKKLAQANHRSFGLESAREADSATLTEPMAVAMVRLDELRKYEPADSPDGLVKPIDKVLFPVATRGQVRAVITATGHGSSRLAAMLAKTRADVAAATKMPVAEFFMVDVPALNVTFVAHRQAQRLMLTPIRDDPQLNLTAGKTAPASEVLGGLVPAAREHNGLPR
jgi:hypothetical protein